LGLEVSSSEAEVEMAARATSAMGRRIFFENAIARVGKYGLEIVVFEIDLFENGRP
jgi:hypothetical protein